MKHFVFLMTLIPMICLGQGQYPKGKIVVERIFSPSLENKGGENPTRRVTIYLPPDYDNTINRYPTIYYLHGFTWDDSLTIASDHFDELLNKAIGTGKIKPVIVVLPDEHTTYRGSFYTNSTLAGKWADFTAKDLVNFIDQHYRTIASKDARGVTGHSMGGHGAIKMGMLFPDVFSCVYALSPAALGLFKELGPAGEAYRNIQNIKSKEELTTGERFFQENAFIALARAFSPNPNKPPFFADLPFNYQTDKLTIDYSVLKLWNDNLPIEMIDTHVNNLKMLKALKLDWGRNDNFPHIPIACQTFSQKLENLGISHYAEEYIGDHGNKLWTDDGRALNEMIPFFNSYLSFEEIKYKTPEGKKKTR